MAFCGEVLNEVCHILLKWVRTQEGFLGEPRKSWAIPILQIRPHWAIQSLWVSTTQLFPRAGVAHSAPMKSLRKASWGINFIVITRYPIIPPCHIFEQSPGCRPGKACASAECVPSQRSQARQLAALFLCADCSRPAASPVSNPPSSPSLPFPPGLWNCFSRNC